jgi:uncharacterized protein
LAVIPAIVDTGPLVAFFDRAERHHRWVAARIEELGMPLLVCEPVLTEVAYLLAPYAKAQDALFELLHNGALSIAFRVEEHVAALRRLLQNIGTRRCRSPMPVSSACPKSMSAMPF